MISLFSGFRFSGTLLGAALVLALLGAAGCGDNGDAGEPDAGADTGAAAAESFEGASYAYDMTITMENSVQMEGAEMIGTLHGNGAMTLVAGSTTDKGTRWQATTEITMAGDMMGTPIDTMTQEQTMIYTVSPDGKLVDLELAGVDENLGKELTRMMESAANRQSAMQMFMQEGWLDKQAGETWEEETLDTIDAKDVSFGPGTMTGSLKLITRTRSRYTYEGSVDTLGTKAVRLKYELLELSMNGGMEAKEVQIDITSNGTGNGTFYYSVDDRLQLAAVSDLTMSSVIAMPSMNQTMPMKQRVMTTIVRRNPGQAS